MNLCTRYALALLPAFALCAVAADTTGCAAVDSSTCIATPFISPVAVTLDHTATGAGNSQIFSTGVIQSGSHCISNALAIKYTWNVSDPMDATVASDGTVSCVNATTAPITVYSSIIGYSGTGNTLVAQNTPTNLPSATLTCK